jgi:DNA-directed RNA polymerase specialized sigma24 family protein
VNPGDILAMSDDLDIMNVIRQHLRGESRRRTREMRAFEETLRRWKLARLESDEGENRLDLLRGCVDRLDPESLRLVRLHHLEGFDLAAVGEAVRKSAGAVAVQLLRIRAALARCVRAKMQSQGIE